MTLEILEPVQQSRPGQFFMLRMGSSWDPLLRRPFSVFKAPRPNQVQILYQVVGRGTVLMSRWIPGDRGDVVGPLGTPFPSPPSGSRVILVGGGVGIPPLYFFAETLLRSGLPVEMTVCLGAKSQGDLLCQEDFATLGVLVHCATEDGSQGHRGLVTDLLEGDLSIPPETTIYACGPVPMLRAVAKRSRASGVSCYVSMEERMACGLGVCMGCAVAVHDSGAPEGFRYAMVCAEGPVFPAEAVRW